MALSDRADVGFRMFALDSPQTFRTIHQKLLQRQSEIAASLIAGAVTDWAHYQRIIGKLEAYAEAMALCDDIEKLQEN